MSLTAAEVMTSPVVTARRDMTVRELIELLSKHQISGVPVVDSGGDLQGVVSLTDLALLSVESRNAVRDADSDYHSSPALDGLSTAGEHLRPEAETLDDRIWGIMSPDAIVAEEQTSIGALADMMLAHLIHRIVIVRGSQVVGIVSIRDILVALRDRFPATD